MKKFKSMGSIVLLAVMFTSCEKVVGEGPVVAEERAITNFKGLSVSISGNVYYDLGPAYRVEVRAQQNILDVLQTNLQGDELVIKIKDGIRVKGHESISIYITAPTLEWLNLNGSGNVDVIGNLQSPTVGLRVSGSGNLHAQQLTASDRLTATISGSGNITIDNGTVVNETLKISGSGKMDITNVVAQKVWSDISGSGDLRVHVVQNLDASISGSGSVLYKGTPLITTHISGSGSVRPF